jgi:hypothetical protein
MSGIGLVELAFGAGLYVTFDVGGQAGPVTTFPQGVKGPILSHVTKPVVESVEIGGA